YEELHIRFGDLQWPDWPLISDYFVDPRFAHTKLLEDFLSPALAHRRQLLSYYAPFLSPPPPPNVQDWTDPRFRCEGCGWLPAPVPQPEPKRLRRKVEAGAENARRLLKDYQIGEVADRALRNLLGDCARNNVQAVIVLLPEHSVMRACYTPEVRACFGAYL